MNDETDAPSTPRSQWEVGTTVMVLSEDVWCVGRLQKKGQVFESRATKEVGWRIKYDHPDNKRTSLRIDLPARSPLLRSPDAGDFESVYDDMLEQPVDIIVPTSKSKRDAFELKTLLKNEHKLPVKELSFYEMRLEAEKSIHLPLTPLDPTHLEVGQAVMVYAQPLSSLDGLKGEAGWVPGLLDAKLPRGEWRVKYFADWPKNSDLTTRDSDRETWTRDSNLFRFPDRADLTLDGYLMASTDVERERFFLPKKWSRGFNLESPDAKEGTFWGGSDEQSDDSLPKGECLIQSSSEDEDCDEFYRGAAGSRIEEGVTEMEIEEGLAQEAEDDWLDITADDLSFSSPPGHDFNQKEELRKFPPEVQQYLEQYYRKKPPAEATLDSIPERAIPERPNLTPAATNKWKKVAAASQGKKVYTTSALRRIASTKGEAPAATGLYAMDVKTSEVLQQAKKQKRPVPREIVDHTSPRPAPAKPEAPAVAESDKSDAEPEVPTQPVVTATPRQRRIEVPTTEDLGRQLVRMSRGCKRKVLGQGWVQNRLNSNFRMEWPNELGFGYEGGAPRYAQELKNRVCDVIDHFGLFPDSQLVTADQADAAWHEYRLKHPRGRWAQVPPWCDNWLRFCQSIKWHRDDRNKVAVVDPTRRAPGDLIYRVLHCQHNTRLAVIYSDSAREALWVQAWRSSHDARVEAKNTIPQPRWWNQGRKALNGCLRYDQEVEAFVRLSSQELQPMIQSQAGRVARAEESESEKSDASASRKARRSKRPRGDTSGLPWLARSRAKMERKFRRQAAATAGRHEQLAKVKAEHRAKMKAHQNWLKPTIPKGSSPMTPRQHYLRRRSSGEDSTDESPTYSGMKRDLQKMEESQRDLEDDAFDADQERQHFRGATATPAIDKPRYRPLDHQRSYSDDHKFGSGSPLNLAEETARLRRERRPEPEASETDYTEDETSEFTDYTEDDRASESDEAFGPSPDKGRRWQIPQGMPQANRETSFTGDLRRQMSESVDLQPQDRSAVDLIRCDSSIAYIGRTPAPAQFALTEGPSAPAPRRPQLASTRLTSAQMEWLNGALQDHEIPTDCEGDTEYPPPPTQRRQTSWLSLTDGTSPESSPDADDDSPSKYHTPPPGAAADDDSPSKYYTPRPDHDTPAADGPSRAHAALLAERRFEAMEARLEQLADELRHERALRLRAEDRVNDLEKHTATMQARCDTLEQERETLAAEWLGSPARDSSAETAEPGISRSSTAFRLTSASDTSSSSTSGSPRPGIQVELPPLAPPPTATAPRLHAPRQRAAQAQPDARIEPISLEQLEQLARQGSGNLSDSSEEVPITECPEGHALRKAKTTARGRTICDVCGEAFHPGMPARHCAPCDYDVCLTCAHVPLEEALEEMNAYCSRIGMPTLSKKLLKVKRRGMRLDSESSEEDSDQLPVVNDTALRQKQLRDEMAAMGRPRSAQNPRRQQTKKTALVGSPRDYFV